MTRLLEYVRTPGIATVGLEDVNDDILCNSGSQVERLTMLSHGYTELVKDVTTDRATLIDHVYFSKQRNDVLVQVVVCIIVTMMLCTKPRLGFES